MTDYAAMYDAAYASGYRAGKEHFTNGAGLIVRLLAHRFYSVLDVGCGYGRAVDVFAGAGKLAVGIDVAAAPVAAGRAMGRNLVVGSVLDLPFSGGEFEAVFCADVLEHLAPKDVPTAIGEIFRVARNLVAVRVATRGSGAAEFFGGVDPHLTVRDMEWWMAMLGACRERGWASCQGEMVVSESENPAGAAEFLVRRRA